MKLLLQTVALAGSLLVTHNILAANLVCGTKIIQSGLRVGVTEYEVLKECGEPVDQVGHRWIYVGPGEGLTLLVFDGAGQLVAIQRRRPQDFLGQCTVCREAVLNHESGVLVTADISSGDQDKLLVATSEGVGDAVDDTTAEALLWSENGFELVTLFESPRQRLLKPGGGSEVVAATGSGYVLAPSV